MAYKTVCDCCQNETARCVVGDRIKGTYILRNTPVQYEIMLGVGKANVWNGGNLCINCLEDVLSGVLGIARSPRED